MWANRSSFAWSDSLFRPITKENPMKSRLAHHVARLNVIKRPIPSLHVASRTRLMEDFLAARGESHQVQSMRMENLKFASKKSMWRWESLMGFTYGCESWREHHCSVIKSFHPSRLTATLVQIRNGNKMVVWLYHLDENFLLLICGPAVDYRTSFWCFSALQLWAIPMKLLIRFCLMFLPIIRRAVCLILRCFFASLIIKASFGSEKCFMDLHRKSYLELVTEGEGRNCLWLVAQRLDLQLLGTFQLKAHQFRVSSFRLCN